MVLGIMKALALVASTAGTKVWEGFMLKRGRGSWRKRMERSEWRGREREEEKRRERVWGGGVGCDHLVTRRYQRGPIINEQGPAGGFCAQECVSSSLYLSFKGHNRC